jgi:predicted ArsR family transcriptional regulator
MRNKSLNTREIILKALDESNDLTAHDLALASGVGEAAVRYHLRKLKETGFIKEFHSDNFGFKAGRKFIKYRRLTRDNNTILDKLCKTLLILVKDTVNYSNQQLAQRIAENMLGEHSSQNKPGIPAMMKLIQWLNFNSYSAHWEAGKKGPNLHFKDCPYCSIRTGNDILCEMDLAILQKMTGLDWVQKEHMDWRNLEGECVFVVKHSA